MPSFRYSWAFPCLLSRRLSSYKGLLGQRDRVDFYRFTASSRIDFSLELSGLQANTSVRLLNASGALIAVSSQPGNRPKQIAARLDDGVYFIQVQFLSRRGTTRYNLRTSATLIPTPPDLPDPDKTLTGTINIDNLIGGSGNDRLSGLNGNDTLTGGLGNDRLEGDAGSDTYIFRRGDGQDILDDNGIDIGLDSLVFSGDGLTSSNVVVTREGNSNDLKLTFRGGITDSVVLNEQLNTGFFANRGIESITFSNGVIWNEAQLLNAIQ